MKKELLEVLTAEACQLHRQDKRVMEEQKGDDSGMKPLTESSVTFHAPLQTLIWKFFFFFLYCF